MLLFHFPKSRIPTRTHTHTHRDNEHELQTAKLLMLAVAKCGNDGWCKKRTGHDWTTELEIEIHGFDSCPQNWNTETPSDKDFQLCASHRARHLHSCFTSNRTILPLEEGVSHLVTAAPEMHGENV